MQRCFYNQFYSFLNALKTIFSRPVEHLFNLILLALIITLSLLAISINNSLNYWQSNQVTYPQIMLSIDVHANQADLNNIERYLISQKGGLIKDYQLIDKEQAWQDLKLDPRLQDLLKLDAVESNVLPNIFIINTLSVESTSLNKLNLALNQLPMVDHTKLDLNYAAKISDLLSFSNKVASFCQVFLVLLLVISLFNLIRLQMLLKKEAISVTRLCGASDFFVMRPLIYYALIQVALSTILAVILLHCLVNQLNLIFIQFNHLFGNGFAIILLNYKLIFIVWGLLSIFAVFSVFLAVRWVFKNTFVK